MVPEGGQDLLHRGLQGLHIGEVAVEVKRRGAAFRGERAYQLAGGLILDVEEGDARALAREMAHDGFANAGGAAGDQHGAVIQAGITGKLRACLRIVSLAWD